MKIICITVAALATAALCSGQMPARARIDVDGNSKGIALTNFIVSKGSARCASWMKPEQNARFVTSDLDIAQNKWTQVFFTFTPLASGEVNIQLKGNYWKKNSADKNITPVPVYFDAVTVTGGTIVNGDFEERDDQGELKSWYKGGNEASWMNVPPLINNDPVFVKSGSQSIRVWHNAVYSQNIKVTANTPVTINAWVYQDVK
ncbi:MAG: hypothetical protein HZC28_05390 [Spirochaetes bacterium]|nr:hypothetical protein [Spirochaetota bacterium]